MRHAPWARDIEARALSVEEADNPGVAYLERGLGWVPHMATHAQSVVADLTKAALLDPTLRDRVDPHLRSARRRLGEAEFERLTAQAEVELRRRGG
jgi:hypothetical protein